MITCSTDVGRVQCFEVTNCDFKLGRTQTSAALYTEYVDAAYGFDAAGYAVVTVKKYSYFARLFSFVPVNEFGMALEQLRLLKNAAHSGCCSTAILESDVARRYHEARSEPLESSLFQPRINPALHFFV